MKVRLPQNRKNVLQQPLCSEEDEEVTFMLDESAVGLSVEQDFSYTWRDLILYNLSVGAKQEELEYVYEKGLKAVPTFGVIPCNSYLWNRTIFRAAVNAYKEDRRTSF